MAKAKKEEIYRRKPGEPPKQEHYLLNFATIITVCAEKDGQVVLKDMTFYEALIMAKAPGWKYTNYQKGFCAMKPTPKTVTDGSTGNN